MHFVTKPCIVCKQTSMLSLDMDDFLRWQGGELVQNVWPDWTPDQRELLITGTHPECWDEMFKEVE